MSRSEPAPARGPANSPAIPRTRCRANRPGTAGSARREGRSGRGRTRRRRGCRRCPAGRRDGLPPGWCRRTTPHPRRTDRTIRPSSSRTTPLRSSVPARYTAPRTSRPSACRAPPPASRIRSAGRNPGTVRPSRSSRTTPVRPRRRCGGTRSCPEIEAVVGGWSAAPEQRVGGRGKEALLARRRPERRGFKGDVDRAGPAFAGVEVDRGDRAGGGADPVAGDQSVGAGLGGLEIREFEPRCGRAGQRDIVRYHCSVGAGSPVTAASSTTVPPAATAVSGAGWAVNDGRRGTGWVRRRPGGTTAAMRWGRRGSPSRTRCPRGPRPVPARPPSARDPSRSDPHSRRRETAGSRPAAARPPTAHRPEPPGRARLPRRTPCRTCRHTGTWVQTPAADTRISVFTAVPLKVRSVPPPTRKSPEGRARISSTPAAVQGVNPLSDAVGEEPLDVRAGGEEGPVRQHGEIEAGSGSDAAGEGGVPAAVDRRPLGKLPQRPIGGPVQDVRRSAASGEEQRTVGWYAAAQGSLIRQPSPAAKDASGSVAGGTRRAAKLSLRTKEDLAGGTRRQALRRSPERRTTPFDRAVVGQPDHEGPAGVVGESARQQNLAIGLHGEGASEPQSGNRVAALDLSRLGGGFCLSPARGPRPRPERRGGEREPEPGVTAGAEVAG